MIHPVLEINAVIGINIILRISIIILRINIIIGISVIIGINNIIGTNVIISVPTCLTSTDTGPASCPPVSLKLALLPTFLRLEERDTGLPGPLPACSPALLFLPCSPVLTTAPPLLPTPALLLLLSLLPISRTVTYSPLLLLLPLTASLNTPDKSCPSPVESTLAHLGSVARPLRTTVAALMSALVKLELREEGREEGGWGAAEPRPVLGVRWLAPRILELDLGGVGVRWIGE